MPQSKLSNASAIKETLIVSTLMELRAVHLEDNAIKDPKRLQRFLEQVEKAINKLIRGCQRQTILTADELISRPTFKEEFDNIRNQNSKVVVPSVTS